MQTTNSSSKNEDQTKLQQYLHTIEWNNTSFTEKQLRTILGAACMRYLVGLTKIEFIFELSEAIRDKKYQDLSPEFQQTTDILHNVGQSLNQSEMESATTKNVITVIIHHIQKILTGINLTLN